eukprot:SAG31_NODE_21315_length_552_cov_1.278146_1_plen_46_part_01
MLALHPLTNECGMFRGLRAHLVAQSDISGQHTVALFVPGLGAQPCS